MKKLYPVVELINEQPKDLTYKEIYLQLKLSHTGNSSNVHFNFFLDIMALHFDPDEKSYPFSSKLEDNQIKLIDPIRIHIEHPDVSWLLHDLFWTHQRKPDNAKLAAEYACKSAKSLNPHKSGCEIFDRVKRAVVLSDQSQNEDVKEYVKKEIGLITEKCLGDPTNSLSVRLLVLLNEIGAHSILLEFIESELILNSVVRLENSKNWELAQQLRRGIINTLRALKREDSAQENLIELAKSYGQQAAAISSGIRASFVYHKAIRSLQQISLPSLHEERDLLIEKFQALLQSAQDKKLQELEYHQSEQVDLSKCVLSLEKILEETHSFEDCLWILAQRYPLRCKASIESDVRANLQQSPHILLASKEIIDERGRTLRRLSSFEEKVPYYVTQRLSIEWEIRSLLIDHARRWIIQNYSVNESDWLNIVSHNPYIPPCHQEILAKALHQGLNAELLISTHLLLPQFEACFRHILESNGIITQTITTNSTQKDKTISPLLLCPEMKNFLNEDFCFEVSQLLTEDGINFRNNALHGKITFVNFYTAYSIYLWRLAIKLFCFGPILLKPLTKD